MIKPLYRVVVAGAALLGLVDPSLEADQYRS